MKSKVAIIITRIILILIILFVAFICFTCIAFIVKFGFDEFTQAMVRVWEES